jgi:hypothetical protein
LILLSTSPKVRIEPYITFENHVILDPVQQQENLADPVFRCIIGISVDLGCHVKAPKAEDVQKESLPFGYLTFGLVKPRIHQNLSPSVWSAGFGMFLYYIFSPTNTY